MMLTRCLDRLREMRMNVKLQASSAILRRSTHDYGWIKLAFSNDGDKQELYYHLHQHAWHENEVASLRPFLKTGDTAVDIGANVGFMTTILSQLVGVKGRVFAFEPSPRTFSKLQKHIAINGLENVTAFQMGCGDVNSTATLFDIDASSGHATMAPDAKGHHDDGSMVPVSRLDDVVLPAAERVHLLKIDTEGFENRVLRGAQELLKRDKPTIYIELCDEYAESSKEAIEILRAAGYSFLREPDLGGDSNGSNFTAVHPANT